LLLGILAESHQNSQFSTLYYSISIIAINLKFKIDIKIDFILNISQSETWFFKWGRNSTPFTLEFEKFQYKFAKLGRFKAIFTLGCYQSSKGFLPGSLKTDKGINCKTKELLAFRMPGVNGVVD
jgi:hypothetical protein